MEIKYIGVVGAGQMGSGIAEVAISSGYPVLMRDVSSEALEKGKKRIAGDLTRRVEKGKLTGEHGVGLTAKDYMAIQMSPTEIELMKRIKRAFDPKGLLNPGKILPDSNGEPG